MAPIEIQTEKPINASASDPTTTTTAQPPAPQPASHPATNPPPPSAGRYTPSTTTAASSYAPPSAAAPGARPVGPAATPAATASTGPATSAYIPPTCTTALPASQSLDGPPAPQPGAAPVPYAAPTATASSTLPPPPKAGEAAQARAYQSPAAAQHSGMAFQSTRGGGGQGFAHPPGYQQSTPSTGPTTTIGSSNSGYGAPQSSLPLGGQTNATGGIDTAQLQEQAGEAWSTVKGWAGAAGQGLVSAHNEAWKWVDKQSGGKN